jgi:GNAT superfamily N-acetyltransferase
MAVQRLLFLRAVPRPHRAHRRAEAAILGNIRPIERTDVRAFTKIDPARHDRLSARHRSATTRLLGSDIQTCYVAVSAEGAPCYMQYLILPSENDKVQSVFEGIFPRLAEDEALLEGAFTLEEYRGQGIMPFVMEALAQKARTEGARRLLTFVSSKNAPALQGCRRSGFEPIMIVHRRFRLFKRRITFTPLREGTIEPFSSGAGLPSLGQHPTSPSERSLAADQGLHTVERLAGIEPNLTRLKGQGSAVELGARPPNLTSS